MARGSYGEQNGKDRPAKKLAGVGASKEVPFRGFINLELTAAEKAGLDAWVEAGAVPACVVAFVGKGIALAVRREGADKGFLASATARDADSPNAGLVVTARGGDAWKAVTRVLFMVAVLEERSERWEDTQPVADPDRW